MRGEAAGGMTALQAPPSARAEVDPRVIELLLRLGTRFEVIDGLVVVMPYAREAHERLVMRIGGLLEAQAPSGTNVYGSNYNYYYAAPEPDFVNADVLVTPASAADEDGTRVPPLLVVEVSSPSTRRHDGTTKRDIYQRAGVPSCWLVDPDEPSVQVLELDARGRYAEVARAAGRDLLRLERPFPLELRLLRQSG